MKREIVVGIALALAPATAALADQNQNQAQSTQEMGTQRLLPKDAKLVGEVESTEVRAFPEQVGTKAHQTTAQIQKEDIVGAGAVDRVWSTKEPYHQAVKLVDSKLKTEGIEPLAKTTTPSTTAWNMRMPDGHIVNVVVRNTQPTTIESIQAAAALGTVKDKSSDTGQPK